LNHEGFSPDSSDYVDYARADAPPSEKFHDRKGVHLALFLLTVVSTTWVGADHYLAYLSDYARITAPPRLLPLIFGGFWYSGTILLILGAHELGHYFACRYYQVDATRPFFLPMPFAFTGTFGAFIRIRDRIPDKRVLFDIGAAGPFAGFVFTVPALFLGIAMSHIAKVPPNFVGWNLGEPLLFKIASHAIWGTIPDGYSINLHPMAFAAWFGMLATALNLLPVGQLDGGHITFAVLGRRSTRVTIAAIGAAVVLSFMASVWWSWTIIMIVMTRFMGPGHPPTLNDDIPLDRTRLWLAAVAAVVFILCFSYKPIEATGLLR